VNKTLRVKPSQEGLIFAWFAPLLSNAIKRCIWTIVAAVHSSHHARLASGMSLRKACARARAEDTDMFWFERAS
jgi:hypothetical protein